MPNTTVTPQQRAALVADLSFTRGPVRARTFGAFVEHLGRCVYTGIYEPEHPTADEHGFRTDVLDLTRQLGASVVRYPGGNFVSGYRWEDGIGERSERPVRRDLAWHTLEPNWVGVDEFIDWCRAAGVEPMMAVNLGTRGVEEALDLLEYCNGTGGTTLADLRIANGHLEPHDVRLWCLGNEMDGPWQLGHKTPEEYGRLAAEVARAMRRADPDLELVVCGSSSPRMATFGTWELAVLEATYDLVDHISAHIYFEDFGDLGSFLASAVKMDRFIDSVAAIADAVRATGRHEKQISISFDEWNVWHKTRDESQPPTGDDWPIAPRLLEDRYSTADAVVVGNLLISLLRHTDRVHVACLAQLVNVIAPIMTEPGGAAWTQTTFHPFALTAANAAGEVLQVALESPRHDTAEFGEVDTIDAVVTFDHAAQRAVVFAVNRSHTDTTVLDTELRPARITAVREAVSLWSEDPRWVATETEASADLLQPATYTLEHGVARVELPPASWTMLCLDLDEARA